MQIGEAVAEQPVHVCETRIKKSHFPVATSMTKHIFLFLILKIVGVIKT